MKDGRITVIQSDDLLRTLPIESVEGITIIGNGQITTSCISECLKRGISIQYYSPKGSYFGKLSSTKHVNTKRQRLQVRLTEDKAFALTLSKIILQAKLNNQIVLLRRYQRNSKIHVNEEINTIKRLKDKISSGKDLPEISGYEGNAARAYFKGLNNLINVSEFKFNGRNRRPPKDPFNSLLSFGYTILLNDIYGAIESRGLNPYFAFLHQDREKHPTLSSDLIEEWRPIIVDSIAMALINGREISIENFYRDKATRGVYFTKEGLKKYILKIEKRLDTSMRYLNYIDYPVSFRRAIDMQVLQLCKAIEEKDPNLYQPVIIR